MLWRIFGLGCLVVLFVACGDTEPSSDTTGVDVTDANLPVTVRLERSGGVGGITRSVEVSTDELSDEDATRLRDLIAQADFFSLPAEITNDSLVVDDFLYVITIDAGDRQATVRTHGVATPDELRPLLDWLNRALRSGGG